MKSLLCLTLVLALTACSKKKEDAGGGVASGSAMAAPGSAAAGSATAPDTGSGSAGSATMATGSGSDVGSGSAVAAGSGSGSGSGSDAGSAAAGSAAGSAAAGSGSGSAEDGSAFDKLSHTEKMDFMKAKVVPAMKEAFQKFDAKKFANFGCKTCHGKDPKATKYKMPNPELPKLDFAKLRDGKQEPKTAEFMGKVVKPEMAKLLGDHELDMAHPEAGGFACLDCHQQKK